MARVFPIPDEAYKKKKVVVILCAVLLILLLCMGLYTGRGGGPISTETPSPTVVAVITNTPPTTTAPPTVTPTETPLPTVTSTPVPTDTTSPPTDTPRPPTLTPSPSPTPAPPTPTPTSSPSPTPPPTPTPTATPTSLRPPVIEYPTDGSEIPGEGLKVEGTAEPGATVVVYTDEISLGEAQVDEGGNWSLIPVERLAAGDHTIVATDIGTNQTSAPVTFTLVGGWLPITGTDSTQPACDQ